MSNKIDMSLDDIIKRNRGKFRLSRGRSGSRRGKVGEGRASFSRGGLNDRRVRGLNRRGRGLGDRRGRGANNRRGRSGSRGRLFTNRSNLGQNQKQSFLKNTGSVGNSVSRGVSKLLISNLEYGVSDSDIKELFAEFGALRKAAVHYDRSGRSLGTAEVVFERQIDAVRAMKQYNGVPLDGRPMNIQITTSLIPRVSQSIRGGRSGQRNLFSGRVRGQGRNRGGFTRN